MRLQQKKTLAIDEWRDLERTHFERATKLTQEHLGRQSRGEKHPVEDFLFTYYNLKPAQLKRWHPGSGVLLADASERADWKFYRATGQAVAVDSAAVFQKRLKTIEYINLLFEKTLKRTPSFGCFGMHEWAMVYKLKPEAIRHTGLPLRLGSQATDLVVEQNPIACSHYDAYRFFTPEATSLNTLHPTRANQPETEQAGCLHAGMDVYKWTLKLGPIIPGNILLDSFELARDIRQVDMQASPYDVTSFGLAAIAIETAEGKQEYATRQREFAERGNLLREKVIHAIALARSDTELALS